MDRKLITVVIILLLGLAACQQAVTPPTAPLPAATEPPAATQLPAATQRPAATQLPAATQPPAATTEHSSASANDDETNDDVTNDEFTVSPLFNTPWSDRTIYAPGLLPDQQALLDELPGAPITHMRLSLDEFMRPLSGEQAVRYTNTEDVPLNEVYFHLLPNLLDGKIEVDNVRVDGQPAAAALEGPNDILLRVPLPAPLAPGEATTIEMDFVTTPPTDIGRNYGIFAYYDNVLTLAHFYPMPAVYDEDGWAIQTPDVQGDVTYSDTGYYLVEITAPANQTLVGGGVIAAESADGDTQTVTYAAGPMRDFYLVASPNYTVVSDTVDGVRVNSYGPAEHPDGVALALDVAMAALAGNSDWLGAYPFAELDVVATPTSALGVEYPGIIANTERMYDINAMAGRGVPWSVILESTTAHEVGHQWFYSLVGSDQLNEPWLDEALTQYATYRYYLDRYGPSGGQAFFDSLLGRWDSVDREPVPIGRPVSGYDEVEYGAIVYGRGPVFVRELAETMGQETFDAFLRDYISANRLGTATTDSFRALAEQHCACDLGPLFDEWVTAD